MGGLIHVPAVQLLPARVNHVRGDVIRAGQGREIDIDKAEK